MAGAADVWCCRVVFASRIGSDASGGDNATFCGRLGNRGTWVRLSFFVPSAVFGGLVQFCGAWYVTFRGNV